MGRTSIGHKIEGRNTAVVQLVVENIWNQGELTMADRLFAPAYVNHGGIIPDSVHGPEAVKIMVALFRTAFPELHITIEGLTAVGNTVDLQWTAGRTSDNAPHIGQADQRPEQLTGTTFSTLANGKILESWTDWDHVNALRRLRVIPPDAQA